MANDISFVARLKDEVSGKLARLSDNFDRLGRNRGMQALLQGVGMGAGLRMFTSLEGAIHGVVGVAQDAIKNASDLRESMALSEQVFEDASDSIDRWAETASSAFGMTKREALDTAAQFGNAFKNVGIAIDETADKSQTLTRLAADLGSAFNRSSAEAANALRAGLLGEAEPMRRFGVFLDQVAVEAKLVEMGVKKVGGEFTTSQKVMARYQLIMEQTAETQGMFGRDAGSLADAQKSLDSQLEDLSATIGTELLPIMVEWTRFLKDEGVPALKGFMDAAKQLPEAVEGWGMAWDNATGWLQDFIDALPKSEKGMENAAERAKGTGDVIDKLAAAADSAASGINGVGGAADKAGSDLEQMDPPAQAVAESLEDIAKNAEEALVALGKMKWSPEELEGDFAAAQQAVRDADKALDKYNERLKDKTPTAAQARQLEILEGRLAGAKREAYEAEIAMLSVDGLTFKEAMEAVRKYGIKVDWLGDQWARVVKLMRRADFDTSALGTGPTVTDHAAGGPVSPFHTYHVGEEGPETLVMGARGGFVIPGAAGHSGGGGGGGSITVPITVTVDGDVVYRAVERRQVSRLRTTPVTV